MGRDGEGWDGMGRDGEGWDGVGWDGIGLGGTGRIVVDVVGGGFCGCRGGMGRSVETRDLGFGFGATPVC